MKTTSLQPFNRFYSEVHDEEKNRIMEKVYASDVFKEFVSQWGNVMSESTAVR